VLAVVEPDVVRAAVVCALAAPAGVLWRVDVPPLTVTELSGRSGRWNLRAGTDLAGRGAWAADADAGAAGREEDEEAEEIWES
jgi:hypothetical protein